MPRARRAGRLRMPVSDEWGSSRCRGLPGVVGNRCGVRGRPPLRNAYATNEYNVSCTESAGCENGPGASTAAGLTREDDVSGDQADPLRTCSKSIKLRHRRMERHGCGPDLRWRSSQDWPVRRIWNFIRRWVESPGNSEPKRNVLVRADAATAAAAAVAPTRDGWAASRRVHPPPYPPPPASNLLTDPASLRPALAPARSRPP